MNIHLGTPDERPAFNHIWNACFGDTDEVIEAFFHAFDGSIRAFTLTDNADDHTSDSGAHGSGRPSAPVCAALTQFRMGTLVLPHPPQTKSTVKEKNALPVDISYAIGTDPAHRGHGYGSAITAFAAEQLPAGILSVLSPADQGLVNFYEPLRYRSYFYKEELTASAADASQSAASALKIKPLTAVEYNTLREEYLKDRPHIALSDQALAYEALCAESDNQALCTEVDNQALCTEAGDQAAARSRLQPTGFFRCTPADPDGEIKISCVFTVEPTEGDDSADAGDTNSTGDALSALNTADTSSARSTGDTSDARSAGDSEPCHSDQPENGGSTLYIPELLTESPQDKAALTSLLAALAVKFNKAEAFCMTPAAPDSDTKLVHGMVYLPENLPSGFPPELAAALDGGLIDGLSTDRACDSDADLTAGRTAGRSCIGGAGHGRAAETLPAWIGFAYE